MQGMHGVSGSGRMSENCGMEGMHGNKQNVQPQKVEDGTLKQQKNQHEKIPNPILGNKFDLKI